VSVRIGTVCVRVLAGAWLVAALAACASSSTPPAPAERTPAVTAVPDRDGLTVLEHRAQPSPALSASRRNIFRERDRVAPAPPVATRAAVPVEPAPAESLIPPAPLVTLLGLAEKTDSGHLVRTAVISTGGELWIVKEGDTVAGRFRVGAVSLDRVDLRDVQTGTSRVYRLR
jgi:hypothetical protein